jgi:hypothetical protein
MNRSNRGKSLADTPGVLLSLTETKMAENFGAAFTGINAGTETPGQHQDSPS